MSDPIKHVITLHGLGRTPLSMAHLGPILRRRGFIPHHFGYLSLFRPINHFAEQLRSYVERVVPKGAPLFFITHSLGSIILRVFASKYGGEFNLQRAVMLGPPNQGSETARKIERIPFAGKILGPSFMELRSFDIPTAADCLEIGIIAGGAGTERGILPFVSGDNDGIVCVAETELPGSRERTVLWAPHSFMMYRPEVIRQLVNFLVNGTFKNTR